MTENPMRTGDAPLDETPLESWKEIAAHLKRDVSTLKRWEKSEGLPVHRHLHQVRSSVYAYPSELDGWWARRGPAAEASASTAWSQRRPVRALAFAAMLLLALATAGDGLVLRTSASSAEGTVSRLLWTGPLVDVLGAPSTDGTYLAVTDWETGNLAVRDTTTGVVRRLTDNGNWRGWAEFPVPSPDGRHIAYAWFNERAQRDLRVYALETSSARVVYAHDEVDYVQPFAWTPDGSRILVNLSRSDRANQIAFVDVNGSARVLKTLGWRSPQKLALSPDGRHIAYDLPQTERSLQRDVFLLAADGSGDRVLVEHPDDDIVLGWAPDGKRLLFGSDRTGRLGIWAQAVADGRSLGPPELVRGDVPLQRAMGVTRGGALYYSVRAGASDVYTATLDARIGAVVSPPAPLTSRFVGWNRSPDWSADGRLVSYVSQRDAPPRSVVWMGGTLVIRSLATGEERLITPRLATMGTQVRWSPDGRSFLAHGSDAAGKGFFRLSAETGEAELVVREEPPGYVQSPVWSPDSKRLFYLRTTPGADRRLRVRDLETGEDHELLSRSASNLAISPDGRRLVLRFSDPQGEASILAIVPASGGEARELLRVQRPHALPSWSGLAWTPDARHILFTQTSEASRQQLFELWRIPVEGGTPQRTGIAMEGLRNLRVHPDGERIVFSAGQNRDEIWVMENFLGKLEPAR